MDIFLDIIEEYKARLIVCGVAFRMLLGAVQKPYSADQRARIILNAKILIDRAGV